MACSGWIPRLPEEMDELRTRFRMRGAWLDVQVTRSFVEVRYVAGQPPRARVGLEGHVREVRLGATLWMPLDSAAPGVESSADLH